MPRFGPCLPARSSTDHCTAPDAAEIDSAAATRIEARSRAAGPRRAPPRGVRARGALPPSAAWFRELGQRFVAALCATADLEDLRERAPSRCANASSRSWSPRRRRCAAARSCLTWRARCGSARVESGPDENRGASGGPVQSVARHARARSGIASGDRAAPRGEQARAGAPFAFLATYTARLSRQGALQHVPLGRAVEESAGKRDRGALLTLLSPLHRASERSKLRPGAR